MGREGVQGFDKRGFRVKFSRATVSHAYCLTTVLSVPTLIVNIISLSVTRTPAMKRLGCRWVGTCASSSDASPLYIHDRSNVVQ